MPVNTSTLHIQFAQNVSDQENLSTLYFTSKIKTNSSALLTKYRVDKIFLIDYVLRKHIQKEAKVKTVNVLQLVQLSIIIVRIRKCPVNSANNLHMHFGTIHFYEHRLALPFISSIKRLSCKFKALGQDKKYPES